MLAAPVDSLPGGGTDVMELSGPIELASHSSGGEEMVQDFVSLHMMSILQPFTESLRELQARVAELQGESSSAQQRLEGHDDRLGRQEEASRSHEAAAQEVASQVEKALAELLSQKREKSRLDGNHEMTKASVAKTKDTLASLAQAVESAQVKIEEHGGRLGVTEVGLAEMEKRLMDHLETRLDKQGRVVKEVNVRQVDVLKTCEKAREMAEAAAESVKKLSDITSEQRSGDAASFGAVSEQLAAAEARLAEVQQRLSGHDEGLKAVDREVQNLRTWTETLKDVKDLDARQAQLGASLEELAKRLGSAEAEVSNLSTETLWSRKDSEMGELKERIGFVTDDVKQLLKWRDLQKTQGETLSSAGHRLDELEAEQKALAAHAEGARTDLDGLAGWRGEAARMLEDLTAGLGSARAEFAETRTELRDTSAGLQSVRCDVVKERDAMVKLSSRVDMCCKYFNGLGKGLQDTSRQILSGEGGVLPAKQGGPKLPALPSTPRTIRASSPSPLR